MKSNAIAVLTILLALSASAQSNNKKKSAAKTGAPSANAVTLVQVNDRRGESFAKLSVTAEVPAVPQADVAASRVVIRKAIDDTGRDLIPERENELESSAGAMFGRRPGEPAPARVTIELKNPARLAKTVPEISGDVELYMPSKDPNGVAMIKSFLSKPGKPILNPILKANGIEIIAYDKAQLEEEKKRQAEKKKQEAVKEGLAVEFLETVVTNFLSAFVSPSEGDVVLRISDPNKRIQEIVLLDPKGEEKRGSNYDSDGMTILSTWEGKPEAGWGLRVGLKTPKSLVRYSFTLKDVVLP